jgi:hypothetical protein
VYKAFRRNVLRILLHALTSFYGRIQEVTDAYSRIVYVPFLCRLIQAYPTRSLVL